MRNFIKKFNLLSITLFFLSILFLTPAHASIYLDGPSLIPKAEIFIAPRTGEFITGSTFEAPIYINTKGNSINAISLKINFNPSKMAIVSPSGGKSIFGIWVEPPNYDNKKGFASLVGVIPDGIVTDSGLIATITFKSLTSGESRVYFSEDSSANLNDGLGSNVKLSLGQASYFFRPKAPEGVKIFSDTHPIEDNWYNNNSPILSWEKNSEILGFSAILDNNPNSVPETNITTKENSIAYEDLKDGVWYFHVRANVKGVWGNSSHFQIKIDTKSPAYFKPEVNTLKDLYGNKKYSLSFLTTDALSGINHYEVGSIDKKNESEISSPVFFQTESPYLVPGNNTEVIRVIVRVFDNAGNITESFVDLFPGYSILQKVERYIPYILAIIIGLLLLELIIHYIFGHHILGHLKKAYQFFKKMEKDPYLLNDQGNSSVEKTYLVNNNMAIPKEESKQNEKTD